MRMSYSYDSESKSLVSWIVRDHRYDHSEFDYDLSKSLVSWIVRDQQRDKGIRLYKLSKSLVSWIVRDRLFFLWGYPIFGLNPWYRG